MNEKMVGLLIFQCMDLTVVYIKFNVTKYE